MRNYREELNEAKEGISQLKGVVSIAKVSTVSTKEYTARVIWENGTVSEELRILRRGDEWRPTVGQSVVCLQRQDGGGFILGGI